MNARILALLYGPHYQLHRRILDSFKLAVPKDVPVTLWLNQVERSTLQRIGDERGRYDLIESPDNVKKYVAMRAMMTRSSVKRPDWWIWFDDDSYITAPDWWNKTVQFIEQRKAENICYVGQKWFVHHLPGQWEFMEKATWFRGRPSEIIRGKPGVNFATGAYWWLRADIQATIDWPDVRLGHNGGDTLLGEAIYQNGLRLHHWDYGVQVNRGPRRGYSDAPAGSRVDIRR
jgi:hypothetical protein